MEQYLGDKAKGIRAWEIPVGILSLLMTGIAVDVSIESFTQSEPVSSFMASLTVVGVMLLPMWFVVRNFLHRRLAKKIAGRLAAWHGDTIALKDLDAATGVRGAEKKIRSLLSRGLLKELFFSEQQNCLCLGENGSPVATPEPSRPKQAGSDYQDTLREIRRLNDEIEDVVVSERIDRLERAVAGIFAVIREKPERADEAKKLLNYYLPTTMKLLESYDLMEDQSHQGENIRTSRARIEEMLEKLIYAVEQQQDRLFLPEAMDVEAEIRTMETMLQADGLARDQLTLKASERG